MLAVRNLSVTFGRRVAVDQISFDLAAGERLGLVGESGSGKSITALAIMGLCPPTATVTGSIELDGLELVGQTDRQLSRLRGDRVSMVFQEPMTALDPTMPVGRQVAEAWTLHAGRGRGTKDRVLSVLTSVGLSDATRVANSFPHQLSGGQRQRVGLAMALINTPELVLCDEPTTALDVTVQAKVLQVLDRQLSERRSACLFISHDLAVVSQVCSQVLVMAAGQIVEHGPIREVFGNPTHRYTQQLLRAADLASLPPVWR